MGAAHGGQSVQLNELKSRRVRATCRSWSNGMLAVAVVPRAVNDGAEPEDAEDVGGVTACGPKSSVASRVAAAGMVAGAGAATGDVQVG